MTASDPRAVRWGVLGATAFVAQQAMLPAIAATPEARLVAVASERGPAAACERFRPLRSYRAYAELLEDPEVEAVYVPLPNALHREWVERAAKARKHVLCEKPLAESARAAAAMAAACAEAGVVLLEAYATPFHPRTAALDALVRDGRLGALRFARAAFTFTLARHDHRWRPELGGGALLDVGIYCLAPLLRAAGRAPRRVAAAARQAPSGVEAAFSGWLDFGEGFTAAIECAFEGPERQALELVGTEAAVHVERAHTPGPGDGSLTFRHRDGREETLRTGTADPYRRLIEHAGAVIRRTALPRWPTRDSVAVLTVVDRLRAAVGEPVPA